MSIVKNTMNRDTAVTIRRFPKNTNIASILGLSGTYSSVIAKYYLQMNNVSIGQMQSQPPLWPFAAGDSVFILCEINEEANGPLFGARVSASNNIYIIKNGSQIEWCVNDTVVCSVDWSSGIHVIGWLGMKVNGVLKCQPWYDTDVVSGSTASVFTAQNRIHIGGVFVNDNSTPICINYNASGSWAIRLYEVYAESSTNGTYHLYACQVTAGSSTVVGMFEPQNTYNNINQRIKQYNNGETGYVTSISAIEFPEEGYGVQLEDLRYITGSEYDNAIAILAKDNGYDTAAGFNSSNSDTRKWKLTKSGEQDYSSAFYLGDANNHVEIPDGRTIEFGSGDITYAIGDLIRGHKPWWSIWADAIKFGKYATTVSGGGYKIHFNLYYSNAAVDEVLFDISKFENYDTGAIHAPNIGLSGTINYEYHNGYCAKLADSTRLIGSTYDRCCVFAFNREGGGLGKVKLGNLALWNYTDAEQSAAASTNLSRLVACGAGLRVTAQDASGAYQTVAMMCKSVADTGDMVGDDPLNFCAESNQNTKDMFRNNGFDCTSIITDKAVDFMRDSLSVNNPRYVTAELSMLKTTSSNPADDQIIDCSELVPTKLCSASGAFDTAIFPTYTGNIGKANDRFVVGDIGGTSTIGNTVCQIGILGNSPNDDWGESRGNDDTYDVFNCTVQLEGSGTPIGKAVYMGFGIKNGNNVMQIVGGSTPMMAFLSVYAYNPQSDAITGKYFGFTKVISTVFNASTNPYRYPFPYNTRLQWMYLQPYGIYADSESSYEGKRGVAMFMWKDLKGTRNASEQRPTDAVTCHMRAYAQDSGVHSWYPYNATNALYYDSVSENPYAVVDFTNIRRVYFHNAGEILTNHASEAEKSDYVNAWITLWNNSEAQVSTATALDGKTLTLYKEPLHEPKDSTSGVNPTEVCHFTFDSTADYVEGSVSTYKMYVKANQNAPFYSHKPYNDVRTGQFNNTGFYNIRIVNTSTQPSSGAMYYIKIS